MLPQSRDYVMNPLLSRTQGLEGLAEALRSWHERATDRPTSLLAGPLASDVLLRVWRGCLESEGLLDINT